MSADLHPFHKRVQEAAKAAGGGRDGERQKRQEEWVNAVNSLFANVTFWLKQDAAKGYLQIVTGETTSSQGAS